MTNKIKNLKSYRIDICFYPESDVNLKYWIGAVLRNRFLYAADKVTDINGISLRQIIDTLPLSEEHFLFKQLKGGFPKGFLFDCSTLPHDNRGFVLKAETSYSFGLILIGKTIEYRNMYEKALRIMLESGFGEPVVKMKIISISNDNISTINSDIISQDNMKLGLKFITPVNITPGNGHDSNGFQNKMNQFPSFYQFIRSLAYRIATLSLLYCDYRIFNTKDEMDNDIEKYVSHSVQAILTEARISRKTCYSTPKKGKQYVYTMHGYTGELYFENVPSRYIPIITFGKSIGVGADINYGLGCYDIIIRKTI